MNERLFDAGSVTEGTEVAQNRACSSAGERYLHTVDATGSIPVTPTTLTQNDQPGWVYFIRIDHGSMVKIGWSVDPDRRFRQIAQGFPFELTLMTGRRGTRKDERELHERFKHLRLGGEWFKTDKALRGMMGALTRAYGVAPWRPPEPPPLPGPLVLEVHRWVIPEAPWLIITPAMRRERKMRDELDAMLAPKQRARRRSSPSTPYL